MQRIWKSRESEALEKGLALPPGELPELIRRFLLAREIQDPELIQALLQPRLQDLTDPMKLKGMPRAVERLVEAFRKQEKICVYADFDLDGTSGLALLLEGLETLGYRNLVGFQPKRLSEGYGFHASAVEELARDGVQVIVTVDVGITAFEAAKAARSLGVDVVLTDHHLPVNELPDVHALVNPNQGECPSGLGYLCGAGVAFYLVRALKRGLVDAGLVSEETLPLKGLLDFLTIATLTDMVPLVRDNRALVRQGLAQLSVTERPGLKVLLGKLGLQGKALSSQDVAIKFAPKLNALSRMETGLRPIDLMRAADHRTALQMVEEVLENNSARVEFQSQGESRAREMLQEWTEKRFVFLAHAEFHRGVVGLIATKIAGHSNVPAFIGSLGADGLIVGSGRTPPGSEVHLLEALGAVSGLLTRFGGHAGAAGFECRATDVEAIRTGLSKFFSEFETQDRVRVVDYDLDVQVPDLNAGAMKWFESLGPYGQGFPQPLFRLNGVRVLESRVLRGGHRKLLVECPRTGKTLEALYFSPPSSLREQDVAPGESVGLLGELQWNDFAGQRSLQFLIRDLMTMDSIRMEASREVSP